MTRVGLVLLSVFVASQTALADEQADKAPEPKKTDIESVIAADSAKLSAEEKKGRTEQMLRDMRDALKRGTELLAEARAAKDIVQLNCVNEKLTQIKGLLKISEQASVKMYEALATAGEAADVVNHEFTKMAVAHQKVLILRAEADQCVGEATIYAGETEVLVEVEETVRDGDPTASPASSPAPIVPTVASGS